MSTPPLPRFEVTQAVLTSRIINTFAIIFVGLLLIANIISVIAERENLSFKEAKYRWRLALLAATTTSFLCLALDDSLVLHNWTGDATGCNVITWFITWIYIIEKQFMNLFLYDRAKIVHESLQLSAKKEKYLKIIRWGLWLTVVVGVPLMFYWTGPVAFGGKVAPEGNCIFISTIPVVIIVFAVADACLAFGMLLIFLFPLFEHHQKMKAAGLLSNDQNSQMMSKRLQNVVRHNIICSAIALSSSVLCLTLLAILHFIALNDGTSNADHIFIWAFFVITCDNLIGICAVSSMTKAWIPKQVQRLFSNPSRIGGDTTSNDNDFTSNGQRRNTTTTSPAESNRKNHRTTHLGSSSLYQNTGTENPTLEHSLYYPTDEKI